MEPRWTIYCHIHVASGRRYVGLTKKTMLARWNQHVYTSESISKKGWSHFANAIRKYGRKAFSHEVLETCETLEIANAAEEKWIIQFDTRNPEKGFNVMAGGAHTPHPVKNPWDRPEFREANAGRNVAALLMPEARAKSLASLRSPESKAKRSALAKASLASPGTMEKHRVVREDPAYAARISASTKAALSSPEVRAKISAASRAARACPETRERIVSAVRAAAARPEVRAKISAASLRAWSDPTKMVGMTGRRLSEATRAKIGEKSLGRRHTPESVEEQRRLYLERSSECRFCGLQIDGKRSCIRGRVCCLSCRSLQSAGLVSFLRPDGLPVLSL